MWQFTIEIFSLPVDPKRLIFIETQILHAIWNGWLVAKLTKNMKTSLS